jgi:hypothetical protein
MSAAFPATNSRIVASGGFVALVCPNAAGSGARRIRLRFHEIENTERIQWPQTGSMFVVDSEE